MLVVRPTLRAALLTSAALLAGLAATRTAVAGQIYGFNPNDLVIDTVSSLNGGGLDTAAPMVLDEFSLGAGGKSASNVGTLALPQTSNGNNSAISGEYGSASEGILQQSVDGHSLTIMGYGVTATTFNTA